MQGLITLLIIFAQVSGPSALEAYDSSPHESIGQMPEVVVTAPRYENEDDEWAGQMPEVVVQAPRYEDDAWAGLMPETVVTAPRYENEDDAWAGMMIEVVVVAEHPLQGDDDWTKIDQIQIPTFNASYNRTRYAAPAHLAYDIEFSPDFSLAGTTVSGDYHVAEGDTIDEDITVSGGNAEIDGVIDGDLAVMGGEVDVNGTIDGDVAVFGGNLDILGTITGDAAVFGGNVKNKGIIENDLLVIGGTVILDSGSVVKGNINMVGGTVDRDEHAEVLGDIESVDIEALEKLLPRISKVFRLPRMIPGGPRIFPRIIFIGLLVVVYVFNLLILLIFPGAIDRVALKVEKSVWASVGLGLAMEILFIPLMVLFVVSIIGIPLMLLLPFAVLLAFMFGFSSLAFVIGERVAKGFSWQLENRVGLFSLGWISVMIIPIITILIGPPIIAIGIVIMYIALTIGLGAVIYALIKRKNKEGKK